MIVRDESLTVALRRRFAQIRAAAAREGAPDLRTRRSHLGALERIVKRYSAEIAGAIASDFGQRSTQETRLMEIFPTLEAARHARRNLARWMAPQPKGVAPYFLPARARVTWQPLGVVGVMVPWNYPLLLALQPLVAVLAAGNRAMIKMSEFTPHTARALGRMLHAEFAADRVRVELGGIDIAKAFAALPFDHLLFTGSTSSGRSVMRAAAQNLTPVTLELGGKSPAIVGFDAALGSAAARIMSGKCRNAGQTCIAPDYVLLPHGRTDEFIGQARRAVNARYPSLGPASDYTSIVNDAHFERLSGLLADASAKGATVIPLHAGAPGADRRTRSMPPVVVADVDDRMRIMREEVFGPLLPLRTYRTLDEAIAYVNALPRPLALYYFGENPRDIATVLERTVSGGACINDVMLQFAENTLPFGGVGESGTGAYHGRDGFERLSHKRAIFEQSARSATGLLEPPYGKRFKLLLRLLTR